MESKQNNCFSKKNILGISYRNVAFETFFTGGKKWKLIKINTKTTTYQK